MLITVADDPRHAECCGSSAFCARLAAKVKALDTLEDCCVSLRGPSKRFPTRHKDFQGAHGNEIQAQAEADASTAP